MKNTSTIQEHDIKVGVTLNAFIKKAPKGFASLGEYLSARKLQRGEIRSSSAHSHLHDRTQSVVMAEGNRLSEQAKEFHKETSALLTGIKDLLKEASQERRRMAPNSFKDVDLQKRYLVKLADDTERTPWYKVTNEDGTWDVVRATAASESKKSGTKSIVTFFTSWERLMKSNVSRTGRLCPGRIWLMTGS